MIHFLLKKDLSRWIGCGACLLLTPALSAPLYAQSQAPDSGQLLQESQQTVVPLPTFDDTPLILPETPETVAEDGATLSVERFAVSGNQLFDDETLLSELEGIAGQELTFGQLQNAANRLANYYRRAGYILAQAYLPQQEVQDGVITIAILEGQLESVDITNHSRVRDRLLEQRLSGLTAGSGVRAEELEHTLLRLNDLVGVEAQSTLVPGETLGGTRLEVDAQSSPLLTGSISLDNHGNPYTGEYRMTGQVEANSLAGLGDQLSVRAMTSDEEQLFFRAGYQLPVTSWDTYLGVSFSEMAYELSGAFADLGATGEASTVSVYAMQNLFRSRRLQLDVQLNYDRKNLTDKIESFGSESDKESELWTAGVSGHYWDPLGVTAFSVSVTQGDLTLNSFLDQFFDAEGPNTAGSFQVIRPTLMRIQPLAPRWNLRAQLSAQFADGNLDSSEKFSLGGAYGVRAYRQGIASGDEGWNANLTLQYQLTQEWELKAFLDHGDISLNHSPYVDDEPNTLNLSGTGLGATWEHGAWQASLTAATALGSEQGGDEGDEEVSADDSDSRVWGSLSWHF